MLGRFDGQQDVVIVERIEREEVYEYTDFISVSFELRIQKFL